MPMRTARARTRIAVALLVIVFSPCVGPGGATATEYLIGTQADYDAIRTNTFSGGDRILFLRGEQFSGQFAPRRDTFDNTVGARITIGAYGTGPRPILENGGTGGGTIHIADSGGWIVENLDIRNAGPMRAFRVGIYVRAQDSGVHNYFRIQDNVIRDVDGEAIDKDNGGVVFRVYGDKMPTEFNDIIIARNLIGDISGVGIRLKSSWETSPEDPRGSEMPSAKRRPFDGVLVQDNVVSNTTKNAIIVASSDGPIIERNRMGPNIGTEHTGNSLFVFATDHAKVRNNEAYGNTGPATDQDRGGYDADYRARHTRIEYNYSHDNNFAFAIMKRFNEDVRIRYNISENEREGLIYYGFPTADQIAGIKIHNNTFFATAPRMRVFMNYDKPRKPVDTEFTNNIFAFAAGDAAWGHDPLEAGLNNTLAHNLFFGLEPKGTGAVQAPPGFVAAGTGGTNIDFADPDRLAGYRLCAGSSAVDTGIAIPSDDGTRDYWGTAIGETYSIGAYEGSGEDCRGAALEDAQTDATARAFDVDLDDFLLFYAISGGTDDPVPAALFAAREAGREAAACRLDDPWENRATVAALRRFHAERLLFQGYGLLTFEELAEFSNQVAEQNRRRQALHQARPKMLFGPLALRPESFLPDLMAQTRIAFLNGIEAGTIAPPDGLALPDEDALRAAYRELLAEAPPLAITLRVADWPCASEFGVCKTPEALSEIKSMLEAGQGGEGGAARVREVGYTTHTSAAGARSHYLEHRERLYGAALRTAEGGFTGAVRFPELASAGIGLVLSRKPAAAFPYAGLRKSLFFELLRSAYRDYIDRKASATTLHFSFCAGAPSSRGESLTHLIRTAATEANQ